MIYVLQIWRLKLFDVFLRKGFEQKKNYIQWGTRQNSAKTYFYIYHYFIIITIK